jgi:hypothetical protein
MKRQHHSPEQGVRKVTGGQELLAEGKTVDEVAKYLEVTPATWHRWLGQYGVSVKLRVAGALAHSTAALRRPPFLMPPASRLHLSRCGLVRAWRQRACAGVCPRAEVSAPRKLSRKGTTLYVIGVDAHKRSHTAVIVTEVGARLGVLTVKADHAGHQQLVPWARSSGEVRWALGGCRDMARRLESDLLGAGEAVVRVPPKLMAHARDAARAYGKPGPIDALAVARAALREPNLPVAVLDGPDVKCG